MTSETKHRLRKTWKHLASHLLKCDTLQSSHFTCKTEYDL